VKRRPDPDHLGRVARTPCAVCWLLGREQKTRTECHHPREGVGMAQRQHDRLAIGLCTDDHTGPQGLHGDRTYMHILKADEMDLLAVTLELLDEYKETL
jgi:hypothetical protein